MVNENVEVTFGMIKPDAVEACNTGKIIDLIEKNGFTILCLSKVMLEEEHAKAFYEVHKEKPFFKELVEFICEGPVVAMALMKENAIKDWRELMGATNPAEAKEGTIRKLFGTSITNNAVHGSDSSETAAEEIQFFFGSPGESEENN